MRTLQRRFARVAVAALAVIGWGVALVIAVPSAQGAVINGGFETDGGGDTRANTWANKTPRRVRSASAARSLAYDKMVRHL